MPESLKKLIDVIWYLPWIWEKSAQKLAFFILQSNENYLENFADAISWIKSSISECENCHILIDSWKNICSICSNENRNNSEIIVVEDFLDYLMIEQTWTYNWLYHVLWGAISPINWVFASDLNVDSLIDRIEASGGNIELIMWTNPNIEWEATLAFIKEKINEHKLNYKVRITRLSRWLSSWYLEYADNITLVSALRDRKEIK